MSNFLKIDSFKKIAIWSILIFLGSIVFNLTLPNVPKVSADSKCMPINSGSDRDYQALNVDLQLQQPDGKIVALDGPDDYVKVQAYYGDLVGGGTNSLTNTARDAIDLLNGYEEQINTTSSDSFYIYNGTGQYATDPSNCDGDVVLGYGQTSADTVFKASSYIVLDCDHSTGQYSYFVVSGQNTPSNAPWGGHWEGNGAVVGHANGFTSQVTLKYIANPPPTYNISGSVYYYNGNKSVGLGGVNITTCNFYYDYNPGYIQTSSDGIFGGSSGNKFTLNQGTGFCIRAPDTFTDSDGAIYTNPVITPNSLTPSSSSPGDCSNSNPPPATKSLSTNTSSYEEQIANPSNNDKGGCSYHFNGSAPGGYNIAYTQKKQVKITGKIYYLDSNGNDHGINGVSFDNTCGNTVNPTDGDPSHGTAGNFHFNIDVGTNFCLTPPNSATDSDGITYDKPIVTQDNFNGTTRNITSSDNSNCASDGYDKQTAGLQKSNGKCNYHLSGNDGYNIEYTETVPTVTYKCGGVSPDNFSIGSNINSATDIIGPSSADYTNGKYSLSIGNNGNLYNNSNIAYNLIPRNAPTEVKSVPPNITENTAGSYPVAWSFTNSAGVLVKSCTGTINIYQEPYLKVYGGDVMAGDKFASEYGADSCNSNFNNNAGIYSWSTALSDGSFVGASTEEGAFATDLISGFGSDNNMVSSTSGVPDILSFANNNQNGSDGSFNNAYCIPDYYNLLSSQTNPTSDKLTGNETLDLSGSASRAIYLDNTGDLYINHNNSFAAVGSVDPSSLPMIYVVDEGHNIYIAKSVTQLAGVFIAEPDSSGNGGKIYDCSSNSQTNDNAPFTDCTNKLTVNGTFIAKSIDFHRTHGSVGLATDPAGSCSSPNDNAAEVFCYSPLIWLANPFSSSSSVKTDYISSVPPTL